MADDFIPLNQSTPVHQKWQPRKNHQNPYQNYRNNPQNNQRRGSYNNRWGNNSRSSYGSNSSNNSYRQENKTNIEAYLHPSMLQDPWESLRQSQNRQQNSA